MRTGYEPCPENVTCHRNTTLSTWVYVARQPILDGAGQVFGYELLYRAREEDATCATPGDVASANVFTDAILTMGLGRC